MRKVYELTEVQFKYIRRKLAGIVFFQNEDGKFSVMTSGSKWQTKIENYLNDGTEIDPWI